MTCESEHHFILVHRGRLFYVWRAGEFWYARYKEFIFGPDAYGDVVRDVQKLIEEISTENEAAR